jgi:diguanylate cyclase (GGDEF)-like protein
MTPGIQHTIGRQVAWLSLFPLLIMAVGLETFYLHDRFKDLNHDMLQRGQLIARQLAAGSEYGVFSRNTDTLHELAEKALLEPDVIGVVILDASGATLTSVRRTLPAPDHDNGHPSERHESMGKSHAADLLRRVGHRHPIHDNGEIMLIFQPILASQIMLDGTETGTDTRQAGAVLIELSWRNTKHFKSKLLGISVSASVIFIFFTYLLTLLSSRRITEPVEQLSSAVKAIGAGDLNTRVTLSSCITELCTLTDGINQMTTELRRERDGLQARIDEATQQLRELAFYDTLTHLPNRRLLEDRLSQSLAASKRSGRYGALMFLDLDNFKPINDLYGHAAGDLLLIEAAKRISNCLREMDTVARFGGDEFVVLLNELSSERADSARQAHFVAEKIRSTLEQPYHITQVKDDGTRLQIRHHCSCSVGITLFMNHDAPPEEIMIWADTAMYQAKQDGRNLIRFHEEK